MDLDMDMEIDTEIDIDPELARMQEEAAKLNAVCAPAHFIIDGHKQLTSHTQQLPPVAMDDGPTDHMGATESEDGEVAADSISPTKVYICGLDQLKTSDVRNFASDNYVSHSIVRIEWIDVHSANIVYATARAAANALLAFSATVTGNPLELRRAAVLATHPHVELHVRMARLTDVKQAGPAHRSAYYRDSPVTVPDSQYGRRGYDDDRPARAAGGRRGLGRHYDDDPATWRETGDGAEFDVDLYDDTPKSREAVQERTRARQQAENDLLASRRSGRAPYRRDVKYAQDRHNGRLRNRSASPIRDGDGRFGFSDDQPYRRTARRRSPVRPPSEDDNYAARRYRQKELNLGKKANISFLNGQGSDQAPRHFVNSRSITDLTPEKILHRQQGAQELDLNEVTDALSGYSLAGTDNSVTYLTSQTPHANDTTTRSHGTSSQELMAELQRH